MLNDVVPRDLFDDEWDLLHAAPVRGRRFLPQAAEGGGGEGVSGAVRPGRPGGPESAGGAQPETGGPHRKERLMRKERNPAKPVVTRLCGICYGIKQKERLCGNLRDRLSLGTTIVEYSYSIR